MIFIKKNKTKMDSDQVKEIRISTACVSSVQNGNKQSKTVIRLAGYDKLSASDKRAIRRGTGFVPVPDEERARQRIDAYSYLIR
ncbi:hypothetical protein SAMN06298214_0448 [Bacteroidales bacterium WCE2004]|nr:hypothetical protein SAMN06298214_0448 [Bacteroidales bacterium WCE2004]